MALEFGETDCGETDSGVSLGETDCGVSLGETDCGVSLVQRTYCRFM